MASFWKEINTEASARSNTDYRGVPYFYDIYIILKTPFAAISKW